MKRTALLLSLFMISLALVAQTRLTNIPTVYINTENNQMPYDKEHDIPAVIQIAAGDSLFTATGSTRLRGNASKDFPKKPYRIKFEKKQQLLDAPAKAKKWNLINNYGDKTLLRNIIAFEISRLMGMKYTPYCSPVDLVFNGEYMGCYQLADKIDINPKRVDITGMNATADSGAALTGGYLIEVDAYADQEDTRQYFYSWKGTPVTIHSPDSVTDKQRNYIISFYNNMESNWKSWLDIDSYLKNFLVGEMTGNTDTYWSVYMYKERGDDKLYTGPCWDFDLAFDNDVRTYHVCDKSDYVYRSGGSYVGYMRYLTDDIVIYNNETKLRAEQLWTEARRNGLTEEYLLKYIDEQAELIKQSAELNFKKWPIINTYVHQNPRIRGSWEAEVDYVKTFIGQRIKWMDNKLHYDATTNLQEQEINYDIEYQLYDIWGNLIGNDINKASGLVIIRQQNISKKVFLP